MSIDILFWYCYGIGHCFCDCLDHHSTTYLISRTFINVATAGYITFSSNLFIYNILLAKQNINRAVSFEENYIY